MPSRKKLGRFKFYDKLAFDAFNGYRYIRLVLAEGYAEVLCQFE